MPSVEQVEDFEVESTIKEGAANIAGAEMKECMTSATTRDEKSDCRKSS